MTDKILAKDNLYWAALVPELSCSDLAVSKRFYCDMLGFSVRFERPEKRFAYLELGSAQIMIEQANDHWKTDELTPPFGRGVNFQIEVDDVSQIRDRLVAHQHTLFKDVKTNWYREGQIEHGQTEFLVQDPDGYLLRLCTSLRTRAVSGT